MMEAVTASITSQDQSPLFISCMSVGVYLRVCG